MTKHDTLTRLGFNEKEIKVFTTLLRQGKSGAASLAKLTNISRPTVYNVATNLVAKGLVAEDLGSKTIQYVALPLEHLSKLTQADKTALAQKERAVQEAITELRTLQATDAYPVPKIRFIEEKQLKEFLYSESAKWDKSAQGTDKTWWGFQDHTLVEQYERWIHWLWKKVHKETEVKLLTNSSSIERRIYPKYPRRHIRAWDKSDGFTSTTWVVGQYVIMVVTGRKPNYLVEIHDVMFAESQRNLFKGIWEEIK
jgi:sugar-specific transcriptional regulator TrmB